MEKKQLHIKSLCKNKAAITCKLRIFNNKYKCIFYTIIHYIRFEQKKSAY